MNVSRVPSILVAPAGGDLTVPAIAALKQTASLVDVALDQSGDATAFADALQYAKYAQTLLKGDAQPANDTVMPMIDSTIVPGLERLAAPGDGDADAVTMEAQIVKSAAHNVADALALLVQSQR